MLRTFGPDRIRLCWVLGHSGILGNQRADALARLGSLSEGDLIVGPDPPICHLYDLINGWVRGEEQMRWGNGSGCYVSRCLRTAVDSVRTGRPLGLNIYIYVPLTPLGSIGPQQVGSNELDRQRGV